MKELNVNDSAENWSLFIFIKEILTLFVPSVPFLYRLKTLEGFLIFLGGRKRVHWKQMGKLKTSVFGPVITKFLQFNHK